MIYMTTKDWDQYKFDPINPAGSESLDDYIGVNDHNHSHTKGVKQVISAAAVLKKIYFWLKSKKLPWSVRRHVMRELFLMERVKWRKGKSICKWLSHWFLFFITQHSRWSIGEVSLARCQRAAQDCRLRTLSKNRVKEDGLIQQVNYTNDVLLLCINRHFT